MDNFCAGCGSPIFPGNRFCTKCGRPVRQEQVPQYFTREIPLIIKSLSARIMACGIIWTVVAGFQLLCGFVLLCVMSLTSNWNSDYIFALLIAAAIIVDFVCIKIYVKTNSALFLQLENAQEMQEKTYV